MSTMPKGHISLRPKLESARPAEHPFVVPDFSPSIDPAVFSNPENDQSLADVKEAISGLQRAVQAIQRGARALHEDELRTVPARHKEALEYGFKVARPALMAHDAAITRLQAEIAGLRLKVSTPPICRDVLASEFAAKSPPCPETRK